MSVVILQILSVLGIILLALLGILGAVLLLVLFFPVVYRVSGKKDAESFSVTARASWLFGLARLRFSYPEPGRIVVRLLWLSLYDSGVKKPEEPDQAAKEAEEDTGLPEAKVEESGEKTLEESQVNAGAEAEPDAQPESVEAQDADGTAVSGQDKNQRTASWISKKFDKLKFTIYNTYDKIKKIWQNISYYVDLLQEDDTRLLFSHAQRRLWKILKSIRPRKLGAYLLFGTGSPDTTGYAFGIYGMLSSLLGPGVVVTPDFERAVLEGDFEVSGHVTVAVLIWNGLRVGLDKRLRKLIGKLKDPTSEGKSGSRKAKRKRKSKSKGKPKGK